MQIDKQQIMDMLKSQIQSGGQDHADQAEQQLPQQVDTDPNISSCYRSLASTCKI